MFKKSNNTTRTVSKTNTKATIAARRPANLLPSEVYEKVRERAYTIYCRRGNFGDATGDWLLAERQIKKEFNLF